MKQYLYLIGLGALVLILVPDAAFAADGNVSDYWPLGASIAIGLAAMGGALAQGKAISAGLDSIGRNPSAAGKVTTPMYVGLAFVESLVILAFVVAFSMLQ